MRLRPTILRPQRGLFIGGQSIPLPDLFDYSSRSGLNLVDALGGSNAAVLGGRVARFANNGYLRKTTYAATIDEILIKVKQTGTSTGSSQYILDYYTDGNNRVGLYYSSNLTQINFYTRIAATTVIASVNITAGNLNTFELRKNGTSTDIYINGTFNQTLAANAFGFINASHPPITMGAADNGGVFNQKSYIDVYDYQMKNSGSVVNKQYMNNLYCSISGNAMTNSGAITFPLITTATPQSTTDALKEGYYQLSGGEQVVDPQFTLPIGAVNHEGGQVHNFISSFVRFPAGSGMNRLDTAKFNTTCSSSIYHDVNDPYRFHVSELNYDTMQTYLQSAYTNTVFASIKTNYLNQLYIDRFFAFAAPISGKTLTYYLTLIGK